MTDLFKDTRIWLLALCLLFASMFLYQCNRTKQANLKANEASLIAEQNRKALGDSTIQLKLTRKQLADADSDLAIAATKVEKLIKEGGTKKETIREIIKVVPQVVQKDVEVYNHLKVDPTDSTKNLITFEVKDSVKSFSGLSTFYLKKPNDSTYTLLPGTTQVNGFKLNFNFVVVKYDDIKAKVTRYKIVPFYIDETGKETQISENTLKFNFRGVELLDKPYQENTTPAFVKKHTRLVGMWGLGLNPVSVAPLLQDGGLKFRYMPSISFGYFLTFQKR